MREDLPEKQGLKLNIERRLTKLETNERGSSRKTRIETAKDEIYLAFILSDERGSSRKTRIETYYKGI